MQPRFHVGQQLWRATFDSAEKWTTCTDCGGTRQIHCTLHDGTMVAVDCATCQRGLESQGQLLTYERMPRAVSVVVTGFTVEGQKIEYHTTHSWIVEERDLFESEAEALARAAAIAAAATLEEKRRMEAKEKPAHSWAWHVTYHRREIKRAEKQLAYHNAKLAVARDKSKTGE